MQDYLQSEENGTKPNNGIQNTQNTQQTERKQLHLNHVVAERPQEELTYTSSKRSINSIR